MPIAIRTRWRRSRLRFGDLTIMNGGSVATGSPPRDRSAPLRLLTAWDVARALATVLLTDRPSTEHAARSITDQGAWGPALDLAIVWSVLPQLRRRILSVDIGADTHRQLHEACVIAAAQSTAIAHRASVVLERLRSAGISGMAFKGVGLMANLYSGPGQRMVNDVDLLVDRHDLERTWAVLADLRFAPVAEDPQSYVRGLDDYRPLEGASLGNQCLVFIDEDRVQVDLHWRLTVRPLAPMTTDEILRRAERVTLYGRPVLVAAPVDAITITAHHALRQSFAPASTLKDLVDLHTWCSVQQARWSVRDMSAHAHQSGMGVPLLALWKILVTFDATSVARSAADSLAHRLTRRQNRDAALLADLFHLQLRQGPVNHDLLCLLSAQTIKRFLLKRYRAPAASMRPVSDVPAELALGATLPLRERVAPLLRALARSTPRTLAACRALLRAHHFGPDTT